MFLDEMPEFDSNVLDMLRHPLEEKKYGLRGWEEAMNIRQTLC